MNRRKLFKLTGATVGATALEAVGIKPPEPALWIEPDWPRNPCTGWFTLGDFNFCVPFVENANIPPHNEETIIL